MHFPYLCCTELCYADLLMYSCADPIVQYSLKMLSWRTKKLHWVNWRWTRSDWCGNAFSLSLLHCTVLCWFADVLMCWSNCIIFLKNCWAKEQKTCIELIQSGPEVSDLAMHFLYLCCTLLTWTSTLPFLLFYIVHLTFPWNPGNAVSCTALHYLHCAILALHTCIACLHCAILALRTRIAPYLCCILAYLHSCKLANLHGCILGNAPFCMCCIAFRSFPQLSSWKPQHSRFISLSTYIHCESIHLVLQIYKA